MMSAFVFLFCLSWVPSFAYARCECGFYDVATGSLWTDALISYFNESDGAIFDPVDKNGDFLGSSTDGALWSNVENLNEWEDGWVIAASPPSCSSADSMRLAAEKVHRHISIWKPHIECVHDGQRFS
ncbi:hypothetical protein IE81DRAFT_111114 [Ceraceosorus guamensis]|uniref:Uncharacterized protein n=1 Tax=Ceraceosorus guamensis TaxID=1522189 RepID=A0A316W2R7_9BASI|nr:hypothetical protein IE81DRAFT_111114 [Ceraceosorus guamensis]PWN42871.1 hypothetical protein IE81DRAFT_111114 [Ceraceosorus guamensis]